MKHFFMFLATILLIFFSFFYLKEYGTNSKRHEIKLIKLGNELAIPFLLNHKKCVLIIDTGAEVTIFDSEQLKDYDCYAFNTEDSIYGINGQSAYQYVLNATLTDSLNNKIDVPIHTTNLQGMTIRYIFKSGIEVLGLLGSDFFNAHDVRIDFKENILSFKE